MAATDMNRDFRERATKVYRELSAIPYLTKGRILTNQTSGELTVTSQWTQRDLQRIENRIFQRTHCLKFEEDNIKEPKLIGETGFPTELHQVELTSISPSQKYQIIIRKVISASASKEDKPKQFIEVWCHNNMVNSIDVKAADQHGSIYQDSQFGCLRWSNNEKYVLYVAERKKPKGVSYFDKTDEDKSTASEKQEMGDQFVYEEDWGEQLEGKRESVLVVLTVETGDITVYDCIPTSISVGQALWSPDDEGIVVCGWWHEPYRLGLIYCTNRRSQVFFIKRDSREYESLSDSKYAVALPTFNLQNEKLVYLCRGLEGGHLTCMKLMLFDWSTRLSSLITDIIDDPKDDGFPGLYVTNMAERSWSSDGSRLILSSFWRSSRHILCVDVNKKSVVRLTEEDGCWDVLDVYQDYILASFSSPTKPHQLLISHLPSEVKRPVSYLQWAILASSVQKKETFQDLKWSIVSCPSLTEHEGFNGDYEGILLQPAAGDNIPLVVFPHGGPHSGFPSNYMMTNAAMATLGFAILMVNYKGSLGFGLKSLESLLGKIGSQDVNEVKSAADQVLEQGGFDRKNVFVMGGSHGGFLSTHLIGQFPDMFRACALRNPVINLASLITTSDIPDWGYDECGLTFDPLVVPDSKIITDLLAKSPISHAHKIVTPTLICLGDVDRRVPPSQGKHLYRTLRAGGIETRVLLYPDNNHPLNKVDAESDVFMNTVCWFNRHQRR